MRANLLNGIWIRTNEKADVCDEVMIVWDVHESGGCWELRNRCYALELCQGGRWQESAPSDDEVLHTETGFKIAFGKESLTCEFRDEVWYISHDEKTLALLGDRGNVLTVRPDETAAI